MVRIIVIVNALGIAGALSRAPTLAGVWREIWFTSSAIQPILLMSLIAFYLANGWLHRFSYFRGFLLTLALGLGAAAAVYISGRVLLGEEELGGPIRYLSLSVLVTAVVIYYLNLRGRALSPALSAARLQALEARIRPHFLFNSINAVVSLVRSDPKRAETALEDMAELFRVLMADNRRLARLDDELALCKRYLAIETLRLGERLNVAWSLDKSPGEALVPPMVLQPLLENAIYHGVEPASEPGAIHIEIRRDGNEVRMLLRNSYRIGAAPHSGNRMALDNIRERLSLHYDAEANLETAVTPDSFEVRITIPYLTQEPGI